MDKRFEIVRRFVGPKSVGEKPQFRSVPARKILSSSRSKEVLKILFALKFMAFVRVYTIL